MNLTFSGAVLAQLFIMAALGAFSVLCYAVAWVLEAKPEPDENEGHNDDTDADPD